MARKTVIRRLAKYLPSSTDLDQLLAREDGTDNSMVNTTVAVMEQAEAVDVITDLNRQIAAAAPPTETAAVSEPEVVEEQPIQAELVREDPF